MPRKHDNPVMDRTVETAETTAKIVELRRQRISFAEIAQVVGMTRQSCERHYNRALAEIPARHVDEHRAEELLLVDDAIADLMILARDLKITPRSRIEAWGQIRGWAERKAKLLGLDAPTQVVTIDRVDQEIAALQRELAALDVVPDAAADAETAGAQG